MDSVLQDFRYAVRMLTKSPGFTAVAVLTLALGIGANTVVFGMVNSVLLRPLPFDRPEQLVKIWGRYSKQGHPAELRFRSPRCGICAIRCGSASDIAAYSTGTGANLTRDASEPLRVTTSQASAELLPMLGVKPALGRLFSADEDTAGTRTRRASRLRLLENADGRRRRHRRSRHPAEWPGVHRRRRPARRVHVRRRRQHVAAARARSRQSRTIAAATTSKCSRG